MKYVVAMRSESGSAVTLLETDDCEQALAAWREALDTQPARMGITLKSVPWARQLSLDEAEPAPEVATIDAEILSGPLGVS